MVNAYANLDALIKASGTPDPAKPLTPRLAERISAGADYLAAAMAVIEAETRLPVGAWSVEIPYEPVDMQTLNELAVSWGVEKYVEELLQAALG